ncbi:MAG: WecB/TagA/CpsF family glycosyltransferase [Candidatus Falkowbacteria bacterium]|nr:WecB/TagA/CpsF family glycosyltransferase [Candidatus Falkowbacteria bacterium]
MKKIHILGVTIDILSSSELKRSILQLLNRRRGHIVTPNPEFLLLAQDNQEFFSVLNRADLSIPDGIGLKFAGWLKGVNIHRYAGSNLVKFLLSLANQKHLRVAVINRQDGLSNDEDINQALRKQFPHLKFLVCSIDREYQKYDVLYLRAFKPDVVFVTLGAPWQDNFIRKHLLRDIPRLGIAMGVGGSFDFITGKIKRAPKVFQALGIEWLWRLIMQPWRWKRIFNAVVVFTFTVLAWQIRRFQFRPNVVTLIINQFDEVLILNRLGKSDYWGLPQGGIDAGEKAAKAAEREAFEETGLKNLQIIGRFDSLVSYVWPKHYTNRGYKGQRQTLFIMRYYGERNAVKLDKYEHKAYKWVNIKDLIRSVSPIHKTNYELFLKKYWEIIYNHEKTKTVKEK